MSLACLYRVLSAHHVLSAIIFSSTFIALLGISIAFALGRPLIFMKRKNGSFHWLSYMIFWPYHLMNHSLIRVSRLVSAENPWDEILPGLFLGRRLLARDRALHEKIIGVLDLTCELTEVGFMRQVENYLCIPLLDTSAPSDSQFEEGVEWIAGKFESGGVYVHCAAGHGRSALFIAGYLLHSGKYETVEDAIDFIRQKRPGIQLSSAQVSVLAKYLDKRT